MARAQFAIYAGAVATLRVMRARGSGRAAWMLERIFGSKNAAVFRVFGNRLLRVPLNDGYWLTELVGRGDYEPEIRFVLARVMNARCAFLDCGANIGWWSLFASTVISSPRRIVAVEASPDMHARLADTASLNDHAFTCLNRAIWNVAGERLLVVGDQRNHARASVSRIGSILNPLVPTHAEVLSTTLDELAREFIDSSVSGVIVKLDVEGSEMRALEGGRDLLKGNCLVVYEDHGADLGCQVTREVLRSGFRVFYCDDALRIHEIRDATALAVFKRDRRRGYNLFACRSESQFHGVMLDLLK